MQKELALLGRLDGPSVVPRCYVLQANTWRQACRMSLQLGRRKFPNAKVLFSAMSQECGLYASHVSDYFNPDDAPARRDLPAHAVPAVQAFLGNTLLTQWLASQSKLTVLDELQLERMAA